MRSLGVSRTKKVRNTTGKQSGFTAGKRKSGRDREEEFPVCNGGAESPVEQRFRNRHSSERSSLTVSKPRTLALDEVES
jgi:hypothetical protein